MRNNLILHIGTTKTGTKSLQVFFLKNRTVLAEYGVDYPRFTQQAMGPTLTNGRFLCRYLKGIMKNEDPLLYVNDLEENMTRLSDAFEAQKQVLLSDEMFSRYATLLLHSARNPQHYWAAFAHLLDKSGAQNATIVIYLRRQDDWAASMWRQNNKEGYRNLPFVDWYEEHSQRLYMDYAGMLQDIDEAFAGRARLVVRRYDRNAFTGGDIYHDFCAAAGIPWNPAYLLPKQEQNTSITFDVAEALRLLKSAPAGSPLRQKVLIPLALNFSRQNPDPPGLTPFDEEKARAFMEPYLAGNRQIAEKYFGGVPLFSEEYSGRPVWTPNTERIEAYRAAFEEAIQRFQSQNESGGKDQPESVGKSQPESGGKPQPSEGGFLERIKRPLRAIKNRLSRP